MDNNILEYQKLDVELNKIRKELNNNQTQKDAQQLSASIKEWQLKILQLEQRAEKLMEELTKLLEVQKKGIALVEKFAKMDLSKLSVDELKEVDVKTSQTAKQLAELDSRISAHNAQVKNVVLDYEMYRKKILNAKQKREESKQKTDELSQQKSGDIDGIKKQLLALEKKIEPSKLAKYKALKQDGIFPVLVPIIDNNTRCGGCGMGLSKAGIDKLKNNGVYECENEKCHRLIYIK